MTEQNHRAIDSGSYEDLLREQAEQLTRLRVRRGNRSLRTIKARATELFGAAAALPISTQSVAFDGQYVSRDKLMWLVRTLMSWDEWGGDCKPPGNRSPELEEWRVRWMAITTAKRARRRARASDIPAAAVLNDALLAEGSGDGLMPMDRRDGPRGQRSPISDEEHGGGSASATAKPDEASTPFPQPADKRPESSDHVRSPLATALTGHISEVNAVAFSPDGALLATGSKDRTVRLWTMATRTQLHKPLTDHTGKVFAVAFSPDGTLLATAGDDSDIRLWDPATGNPTDILFTGHGGATLTMAFSPDGTLLATGSKDRTVRLWTMATRTQLHKPLTDHTGKVFAVAFSPDGTLLATAGDDSDVRLWDPATGNPVGTLFTGRGGATLTMAFSPDGALLATGSYDGRVRLSDMAARARIDESLSSPDGAIEAVAFSPDGSLLATGSSSGRVRLWDMVSRKRINEPVTEHAGRVNAVAFSPDGAFLATASRDRSVQLHKIEQRSDVTSRRPTLRHHCSNAILSTYLHTDLKAPKGIAARGEALAATYQELLEALEVVFRQGFADTDAERTAADWTQLTDLIRQLSESNALLGAALLDLVVQHTDMSPADAMIRAGNLADAASPPSAGLRGSAGQIPNGDPPDDRQTGIQSQVP
ncbi:WD40 repeat domain-containing protein [Streptomyces prunicolor]